LRPIVPLMYVRMIGGVAKTSYCEQVIIDYVKPVLKRDMFVEDFYIREPVISDQMVLPVEKESGPSIDDDFDYVAAVNGVLVKNSVVDIVEKIVVVPKAYQGDGEVLGFGFIDEGLSAEQLRLKFVPTDQRGEQYYLDLERVNSNPFLCSKISPFDLEIMDPVEKEKEADLFQLKQIGILTDNLEVEEQESDENDFEQNEFPFFDPDCSLADYVSSNIGIRFQYKLIETVESGNLIGEASRVVRCVKCSKEIPVSLWKYENVTKILCYGCLNSRSFQRKPDLVVCCSDCGVRLSLLVNCVPKQFTKKRSRCSACVDSRLKDYCLPRLNFETVNLEFCFGDFSIDVDSRPDLSGLTFEQMRSFRHFRLLQFDSLLKVLGFQMPDSQKIDMVLSNTINEIVQFVWEHKHFWMENSGLVNWLKALGPGYSRWGDGPSNYAEIIKRIEGCPNSILDYGCGSGHGISQIKKRFPFADCRGYDVEDLVDPDLEVVCDTVISGSFDVVVMNNVLHHITNLDTVYDNFLGLIGPCTQIVVKDHCATNENIFLLVLVHVCYLGGEIERMVFRSPSVLEDWFSNFGVVCSTTFVGNVYNDVVMNFSANL